MHYNKVFWLLLAATLLQAASAQFYYSCVTPYNTYGRCVPFNKCGFVKKLFEQFQLSVPANYQEDIIKARCHVYPDTGVHICCDESLSPTPPPTASTPPPTPTIDPEGLRILRDQACGKAGADRVSHGKDVSLYEFPWMALLIYDTDEDRYKCGGSLITDRFVLSAAHCMVGVPDRIIGVRLGEHDLSKPVDCLPVNKRICAPPVEDIGVEKTIPHSDYNNARKVNDVALIKLNRAVTITRHIKPICLPIIPEAAAIPQDKRFFIAGWGGTENSKTSDILQKALVPFKTRMQCQHVFKRTNINENHLCAGGDGLIDTCKGDSGGPLFYLSPYLTASFQKTQRYVQYGIVSFGGTECGSDRNSPGIYTNVTHFIPWITRNIAQNLE
ncbi:serine protease grass [Zeugodacus cucurbitae]|uniref:CLIP domain-containing serine protease n=1 Tax=Zeugodacus cucurbitae TaxID=28588 RepID=A0A0A1WIM7_ZEUCU|nr:serine protease grass [Zeugodacus cucurbitae]